MEDKTERRRARAVTNGVALAVVVIFTAFGAIQSSVTSSKVSDQQAAMEQSDRRDDAESTCTSRVLFQTINALVQRTTFTVSASESNVDLQRAQLELLNTPQDATIEEQTAAFAKYTNALRQFVEASTGQQNQIKNNPFPTPEQYTACLKDAQDGVLDEPPTQPTNNPPTTGPTVPGDEGEER